MPRTPIALALAVATAGLVLAQPASAHHGCSAHVGDGRIIKKTREAHVVEKDSGWYGCASRVGRPYRLPDLDTPSAIEFGDGTVPNKIRLSGVFVAYERYTLYTAGQAGDSDTDLYVVDLRTGKAVIKQRAIAPVGDVEDTEIADVVLKRNGSVGWIGRRENFDQDEVAVDYEVLRFSRDGSSRGRATVDAGTKINGRSLTLSADRRKMRWKKAGERHSAPLP